MSGKVRLTFRESGSREEDCWLTQEELSQCARADETETFCSPVPTRHVSNGEYMPLPQSNAQKKVETRITELADEASKKLNIDRRHFLRGAGGLAASFVAMNEVHGAYFKVDKEEMFDREKGHSTWNGAPSNLFVFDDQLHVVRSRLSGILLIPMGTSTKMENRGVSGIRTLSTDPWSLPNSNSFNGSRIFF
jgi:hypothetical protein